MQNSNINIEWNIAQERLRQARLSFNLALTVTAICFLITVMGAGLLLSDKFSSGTITTAVGLVSSLGCFKLAKDSNDRLDQIADSDDSEN